MSSRTSALVQGRTEIRSVRLRLDDASKLDACDIALYPNAVMAGAALRSAKLCQTDTAKIALAPMLRRKRIVQFCAIPLTQAVVAMC